MLDDHQLVSRALRQSADVALLADENANFSHYSRFLDSRASCARHLQSGLIYTYYTFRNFIRVYISVYIYIYTNLFALFAFY